VGRMASLLRAFFSHQGREGRARLFRPHRWRAILPAEAAPSHLRVRETQLWLGKGAHVVHYRSVTPRSSAPLSSSRTADGKSLPASRSFWMAPRCWVARVRQLRRGAAGACRGGRFLRRWPLFGRPALARWSHGAVTLLGDAAHPMLPFLAQARLRP